MRGIIIFVGILQVLGGIGVFIGSKSAIHEILGSLSFGMGILSLALGVAIGELVRIRKAAEAEPSRQEILDHSPVPILKTPAGAKPMRWPEP